jgi:hypothetical protein
VPNNWLCVSRTTSRNIAIADGRRRLARFAQRDVAAFQNQLQKGKFDKDKLAIAIGDLKNIHLSNNNTLDVRDRDALDRDLTDLQALRSSD